MTNIETYYGSIRALKGVSLDVPQGRTVTLQKGANGAGKTTTLKTISGITQPAPWSSGAAYRPYGTEDRASWHLACARDARSLRT